jgi:hypothetical protein
MTALTATGTLMAVACTRTSHTFIFTSTNITQSVNSSNMKLTCNPLRTLTTKVP